MCPPGDSNYAKSFFVLIEIFAKATEPYQSFSTRATWSAKRATCLLASLDLGALLYITSWISYGLLAPSTLRAMILSCKLMKVLEKSMVCPSLFGRVQSSGIVGLPERQMQQGI